MSLTSEEINLLNHQGFIAGPGESEEDFKKRVAYCHALKNEIANQPAEDILQEAYPLTKKWFDIAPKWIPCLFDNHQLALWHGGCAWIFQKNNSTPTGAFLQLRKIFYKQPAFLGIYKRSEFVAHELSHVGRMMFEEPRYEEFLAYQTATSLFQKYFGPLVRSSLEAIIFVVTLILILILDMMVLTGGYFSMYFQIQWLKLIPVGLILFALGRLFKTRMTFVQCLNNLKQTVGESAQAVIYRLTDNEIDRFAQMSSDDIKTYAMKQEKKELRWRQIYEYFRRC